MTWDDWTLALALSAIFFGIAYLFWPRKGKKGGAPNSRTPNPPGAELWTSRHSGGGDLGGEN